MRCKSPSLLLTLFPQLASGLLRSERQFHFDATDPLFASVIEGISSWDPLPGASKTADGTLDVMDLDDDETGLPFQARDPINQLAEALFAKRLGNGICSLHA